MTQILLTLLNVLLWSWTTVMRPAYFRCPVAWHNEGVTAAGYFRCVRKPVGPMEWDGTYQRPERSVVPPGLILGRVYCRVGETPVVVDDRAIGCRRV